MRLPILGSTALMLQCDYQRRTKDTDVFEIVAHSKEIKRRLVELAGPASALRQKFGF